MSHFPGEHIETGRLLHVVFVDRNSHMGFPNVARTLMCLLDSVILFIAKDSYRVHTK